MDVFVNPHELAISEIIRFFSVKSRSENPDKSTPSCLCFSLVSCLLHRLNLRKADKGLFIGLRRAGFLLFFLLKLHPCPTDLTDGDRCIFVVVRSISLYESTIAS